MGFWKWEGGGEAGGRREWLDEGVARIIMFLVVSGGCRLKLLRFVRRVEARCETIKAGGTVVERFGI